MVRENEDKKRAVRQLVKALSLCFLFMMAEIIGGLLANSLAIVTDAAHLLTDLISFAVSLIALKLSSRPVSKMYNFGWYRAEVLGALISVLMIWFMAVVLVFIAILRIVQNDFEIQSKIMMVTAGLGLFFNIWSSAGSMSGSNFSEQIKNPSDKNTIKKANSRSINVRAAFIHVIGDLVQSAVVLFASTLIYFEPEWRIADPICTFIFSILVLCTTFNILKDIFRVLMEGSPADVDRAEIEKFLNEIEGVMQIHDLKIWSLTGSKAALSVHLAIDDISHGEAIMHEAIKQLKVHHNIHDVTVQLETYNESVGRCFECTLLH
ncbi:hypothetical protein HELRODRAFT_77640 [Helobdella robusta]|uniref:Cation efflux protein cytoplasmic domain-containing protein n=1 Tax=Helobdella robusta TaxID=6412 RepID=T1G314_HELRO|nr:hypothetical protein HELRODRAFT_77640 [Helobdella robusta]ESO05531.1 hypothetical protein HELRODRAFT_77640 [Helobdella robusta]